MSPERYTKKMQKPKRWEKDAKNKKGGNTKHC